MIKLKTLKDIEDGGNFVFGKHLRQEVIKWYKINKCMEGKDEVCTCANSFIRKFFNLTEEDLK